MFDSSSSSSKISQYGDQFTELANTWYFQQQINLSRELDGNPEEFWGLNAGTRFTEDLIEKAADAKIGCCAKYGACMYSCGYQADTLFANQNLVFDGLAILVRNAPADLLRQIAKALDDVVDRISDEKDRLFPDSSSSIGGNNPVQVYRQLAWWLRYVANRNVTLPSADVFNNSVVSIGLLDRQAECCPSCYSKYAKPDPTDSAREFARYVANAELLAFHAYLLQFIENEDPSSTTTDLVTLIEDEALERLLERLLNDEKTIDEQAQFLKDFDFLKFAKIDNLPGIPGFERFAFTPYNFGRTIQLANQSRGYTPGKCSECSHKCMGCIDRSCINSCHCCQCVGWSTIRGDVVVVSVATPVAICCGIFGCIAGYFCLQNHDQAAPAPAPVEPVKPTPAPQPEEKKGCSTCCIILIIILILVAVGTAIACCCCGSNEEEEGEEEVTDEDESGEEI